MFKGASHVLLICGEAIILNVFNGQILDNLVLKEKGIVLGKFIIGNDDLILRVIRAFLRKC